MEHTSSTHLNLRGKYRMLNHHNVKSEILGFDKDGLPNVIPISGHFSAGKSALYDQLKRRMMARGPPAEGVINYKMRGPRPTEVLGVDYILVDSDEKYEKLVNDGDILVPYIHDGLKYGLSRDFMDALKNKSIPLMITDEGGLVRLIEYLETQKLPNKVISFMLHTSKEDALNRLFARAGKTLDEDQVRDIKSHMEGLDEEFERYKSHEELFRHVLKNDTIEGIDKDERVYHLTTRAMQIIDLERTLNKEKIEDFREAYVYYVVEKLFGIKSPIEFLRKIGQGEQDVQLSIPLSIPDEVIERYSHEQGISPSVVKKAAKRTIIGAADYFGVLSLYLEPNLNQSNKRFLVDLIEETVGLKHQYKETEASFSQVSKFSLKNSLQNFVDFYISFSPYDPMRTPPLESRIHTLAFESLFYNKPTHISPVPYEQAHKFVEGNGSR